MILIAMMVQTHGRASIQIMILIAMMVQTHGRASIQLKIMIAMIVETEYNSCSIPINSIYPILKCLYLKIIPPTKK